MAGSIVIIALLVVVVPVAIIMSGLVASGLLGWVIKRDVDRRHDGTELLDLSERF